jgi:glutamate N-acetyltransferase/amino-acid N-acetyltransferase
MMLDKTHGVTWASGYRAAAVHCGIKSDSTDVALLVSDTPAAAAGVFTTNVCCAAPVLVSKRHIHSEAVYAILVNSGNANAATGEEGFSAAVMCTEEVAYRLQCAPTEVLVASTGIIGTQLPGEKIIASLDMLIAGLSDTGGQEAAEAILTTDTCTKQCACDVMLSGGTIRIGGMAKGSGMIMPNMATMLAFITTDAAIERHLQQQLLEKAVRCSFNRITVDGDTSTNDCVIMLANGASGIQATEQDLDILYEALESICIELAKMIVRDGEGATKFVSINVEGCRTEEDAEAIARTIANSPLVKTAIYGENPNWGRILAAAGRAGVAYDQAGVDVYLNDVKAVDSGCHAGTQTMVLADALKPSELVIRVVLSEGDKQAEVWTCDMTHAYVDINVAYT